MVRYRIPDTSHYRLRKRKLVSSDVPNPFYFERLPRELRNMIYHLVVLDSKSLFVLDLTSWCPHWSDMKYDEPDPCGLRLVSIFNDGGNNRIVRTPLLNSTQNLNLLMASKWIWREAAPMLYGQEFQFCSIEALAHFLSRLRPETLGLLRHIGWLVCRYRDRVHRLCDVMQYLIHVPMLQTLTVDLPPKVYGLARWPQYNSVVHNQTVYFHNRAQFNIQVARYLAYCLYRNYFGRWMVEVYRQGGSLKLRRILKFRFNIVRVLWCYMLTGSKWGVPHPSGNGMYQPWEHIEPQMTRSFSAEMFLELDRLLLSRQQREDTQQAGALPAGRRTTRNSWKSVDFVAHAGQLPLFDLRIP